MPAEPKDGAVKHATFTIERSYPYSAAKIFAAWSKPDIKARWFHGPEGWDKTPLKMNFREGGEDCLSGGPPGAPPHRYTARYLDIVTNRRIITSYEMHLGDVKISLSLATIELKQDGNNTVLTLTEQGAFLDGYDDAGSREEGTRGLLDAMARVLAE